MKPLVSEIPFQDPIHIFASFAKDDGAVFLDSASSSDKNSRYSFIAIDPFLLLHSKNGMVTLGKDTIAGNPFEILKTQLKRYPLLCHDSLPPFQGGIAGFFSYDLCHHLEALPSPANDDMCFPDMMQGFYDLVIAIDKKKEKAWIFSSGYPEQSPIQRQGRSEKRLHWLQNKLSDLPPHSPLGEIKGEIAISKSFDEPTYKAAIQHVIDYIYAGDVFEVNLSQRFSSLLPKGASPFQLYHKLRTQNPAPFAAFMTFGDTAIASASPERFLLLDKNRNVETCPIKGTRPRGKTEAEDRALAHQLLHSEKDRAENIMIVDLMRNDLSKVCHNDSVKVEQLFQIESFATVHQLVSYISGKLKNDRDAIDLLTACFPGGSVTGAPKIRAMEIIAEIEHTCRGPYCGAIGYIGFDGTMDTSITIRSYAIKGNTITFQAGGAIVADSCPHEEYVETLDKAKALHNALSHKEEGII